MTGIYRQQHRYKRTQLETSCIYAYRPCAESMPPGRKRSASDVNGAVQRLNLNGDGNCGNGGNATGVEQEIVAVATSDGVGGPMAGVAGARARVQSYAVGYPWQRPRRVRSVFSSAAESCVSVTGRAFISRRNLVCSPSVRPCQSLHARSRARDSTCV